jgi:small subunit ribosomal protein S7
MSRSKVTRKLRLVKPDSVYGSRLLSKLVCCMMHEGKRLVAIKLVYGAISAIIGDARKAYKEANPECKEIDDSVVVVWLLENIFSNIAPAVEVRPRRVGGANYQIPFPTSPKRALSLSMRWITQGARLRKERGMLRKLAGEMLDALHGRGEAMKKKEMVAKVAIANKAFAHYANVG